MADTYRAVFFCGNHKKEMFNVAGRRQIFPTGTLLKYFIEINERVFEQLFEIATKLTYISKRYRESDSLYVIDIDEAVKIAKSISELSAPMLLKDLMLFFPATVSYSEALRREEQVHFSKEELAEVEFKLRYDDCLQHAEHDDIEAFYERRSLIDDYPAHASRWRRWISYLIDDSTLKRLSYELEFWSDYDKILEIIGQYGNNLRSLAIEALKLKRSIIIAVGLEESQYISKQDVIDDLIYCMEPAERLRTVEERSIFTDISDKDKGRTCAVTSLTTLISLEVQLYIQHELEFRQCAFCGGYFATRGSKAKYCNYPNEEYEGKACRKIAAQQVYWKSHPMMGEYQKSYSRYRKWINRTTTKDESKMLDYMIAVRYELYGRYGKRKGTRAIKLIDMEIESIFSIWDLNAREMMQKYSDQIISEEECRAALVVPSISERSPILASWDGIDININENDLEKKS